MKVLLKSLFIFFLLYACESDEKIIPPKAQFKFQLSNDKVYLDASESVCSSEAKENAQMLYTWDVVSEKTEVVSEHSAKTYFILPDSETKHKIKVNLKVNDGIENATISKEIELPAFNDHIIEYGIGTKVFDRICNNASYPIYIDQGNTGIHSNSNCGPSSTVMAIKWCYKNTNANAEQARNEIRPDGSWWYTYNITSYLSKYEVPNYIVPIVSKLTLVNELKKGNILILCLDMYYIDKELDSNYRIDKFYNTPNKEWGHFIVVTGYRKVDSKEYFEVLDPGSMGRKYQDNTLKGASRYYETVDIIKATNEWWKYAIVVSKNQVKSMPNNKDIIHARGN